MPTIAVAGNRLYVAAGLPGPSVRQQDGTYTNLETVYAYDAATCTLLWRYATASLNSARGLVAGDETVYVNADDGLHALRAADGRGLWHRNAVNTGLRDAGWKFAAQPGILGDTLFVTSPLLAHTRPIFRAVGGRRPDARLRDCPPTARTTGILPLDRSPRSASAGPHEGISGLLLSRRPVLCSRGCSTGAEHGATAARDASLVFREHRAEASGVHGEVECGELRHGAGCTAPWIVPIGVTTYLAERAGVRHRVRRTGSPSCVLSWNRL
ncbi:MAG TPA: PQQ-binding-like beta-propeller repeat protein [Ktedonobacterales bacterium]|jgi:hypothetical protein|nr:PQQ-binding-like beta-propeller repeat protein [Ktedonobacterales bacterium]